jgi:TRAP-type uncharacterized transport system fused permease subunit
MAYAMLGNRCPASWSTPGSSFAQLIDHLYLTTQGIYGIALGVVATYVFHFVLFGVFAPASASASFSSIAPPGSRGATPAGRRGPRSSARPCSG